VSETSVLGNIGNLIKWRGRGSASWSRNALSASLFMNYVGHYLNNTPLTGRPVAEVPSWITFDLNLGYDFGQAFGESSVLSGTRFSVSAQNVFDRDPPVVLLGGGAQFDANNANVYGRMLSVQLSKKF
jgi:iron complex outermembrane receptor protein